MSEAAKSINQITSISHMSGNSDKTTRRQIRNNNLPSERIQKVRQALALGNNLTNSVLQAEPDAVSVTDLLNLHRTADLGIRGAGVNLQPFLDDPLVTDVLVNAQIGVWVDKGNGIEKIPGSSQWVTPAETRQLAVRIAATCGQRLDDAVPVADGTLPDGTRMNAVLPPLAIKGTVISLRTKQRKCLLLSDLITAGTIHTDLLPTVKLLIEKRANVLISGSTGAGKTTLLSALLSEISPRQRIICLEESPELAPQHPHVVQITVRRPNVQNMGEVTLSDLVKIAMRMRPDRIVIGECRGAEVRDLLNAINTGHAGGWGTIHANSALDVPARLLALGALAQMSVDMVAAQAKAAIDAVLHIERTVQGRKITQVGRFSEADGLTVELVAQVKEGKIHVYEQFDSIVEKIMYRVSSHNE